MRSYISIAAFSDELEKLAFDWDQFKEGLYDEGIPLAGATIGAAAGKGLRGAALGYSAGAGVSMLGSKLKGEEPSSARRLLAGGALGYGMGGLAHGAIESTTKGVKNRTVQNMFHNPGSRAHYFAEEGIPAVGATLGTATAMGYEGKHKHKKKEDDS